VCLGGASCSPACTPEDASAPALEEEATVFGDEAAARGLLHQNRSGSPEKHTILEANGAGVACIDLGSDDDLDLVFAQGCASLEELLSEGGADLALFENTDGHFRALPGPGLRGWWTGLATGDLDSDGDTDLIAAGFGSLRVLLQGDDGKLTAGPELLPPADRLDAPGPPTWCTSIATLDANSDGHLDLYIGCYLDLDPRALPKGSLGDGVLAIPCRWKGHAVYCGPRGLPAQRDMLLLGNGDGTFRDASQFLFGEEPGYTLSVLPFDADGDGDTDIAVACDSSPNRLWISDGAGGFSDFAYEAGFALSMDGRPEAGMGLAAGDVNRDGRLDLAITNFSGEPTRLLLGAQQGYTDITYRYGLNAQSRALLSWGAHLIDFDGDGHLELFTANGHVYPQADEALTGTTYAQPDTLWHLGRANRAERVAPQGPSSILAQAHSTRGSAVADIDADGRPDLVLSCLDGPALLGMNRTAPGNARLSLRLLGPTHPTAGPRHTPRDGTGARCVLVVGTGTQEHALLAESFTAAGYQSASTPWLHFGLGSASTYQSLQIAWPSGAHDEFPAGPANRRLWIREGEGIIRVESL
jgi:hypothetical protein